jgi:hypothetical protein
LMICWPRPDSIRKTTRVPFTMAAPTGIDRAWLKRYFRLMVLQSFGTGNILGGEKAN